MSTVPNTGGSRGAASVVIAVTERHTITYGDDTPQEPRYSSAIDHAVNTGYLTPRAAERLRGELTEGVAFEAVAFWKKDAAAMRDENPDEGGRGHIVFSTGTSCFALTEIPEGDDVVAYIADTYTRSGNRWVLADTSNNLDTVAEVTRHLLAWANAEA